MRIKSTLPFFVVTGLACGSTPLGEDPADPCAPDPASRACLDRRIVDTGPPPPTPHPPIEPGPRMCRWSGDCGRNENCEQAIGICSGTLNRTGICKPRPDACAEIWDPVCGCGDGRDYGNPCEARSAGVGIKKRGTCFQRLCQNDTNCFTGTYCDIRGANDSSCKDCSYLTRWQCEQHAANCSWQYPRCTTTYIEPPPPFDAGVCERKLLDTCMTWTDCIPGGGCTAHDNCGTGLYCEYEPHAGTRYCSKVCQADNECGTGNVCRNNRCTRGCNPWLAVEQCSPRCGGGFTGFYCAVESADAGMASGGACMLGIM